MLNETLIEILRQRSEQTPDKEAYRFLVDGQDEFDQITYGELTRRVRALAVKLGESTQPGDRAILLYRPGLEFIAAFLGCLHQNVVAVPAYPPTSQRALPRLLSILQDARPTVVLTTADIYARASQDFSLVPMLGQLRWLATDVSVPLEEEEDLAARWRHPGLTSEHLAFLQYTSGSTASPKGVMVSHGNLIHNERMIRDAFRQSSDSVIVGWLPLFHDMGLIGNVLQPLFLGARCILMSPLAFLRRPQSWLAAITRYRGTTSGGPNFAYELCARKLTAEHRQHLDLSSWTLAYNGAEPVRAATLQRFSATFADCGFRPRAFYPCYGLAEATLFVTGGTAGTPPSIEAVDTAALQEHRMVSVAAESTADQDAAELSHLVGCGRTWLDQRVLIVDPDSLRPCASGQVGEIWVAGPSVAQGYWNLPEETEHTFGASTRDGEGPFMRTGDLGGFLSADGELVVTGRLKDLIILRGRNHYPQDLELSSETSHPALRLGCCAAFSVDIDAQEQLFIVQEVRRDSRIQPEAIVSAIRRAVAETHQVHVHTVVLVTAGTVPKTSSGKIQRRLTRKLLLSGKLEEVTKSVVAGPDGEAGPEAVGAALDCSREELQLLPEDERRQALLGTLSELTARVAKVQPAQVAEAGSLAALGLDSLMAIELKNRCDAELGVEVDLAQLLEGASLEDLAGQLASALVTTLDESPSDVATSPAEAGVLSWGQRALWFLQRLAPESSAYNIVAALRVRSGLDVEALERVFALLCERHAGLRTTFQETPGGPRQRVLDDRRVDLVVEPAASWSEAEVAVRVEQLASEPFDLECDALMRVLVLERGEGDHVLVLSVHHIITDLWSLGVLLSELRALLPLSAERVPATLPPPVFTFDGYVHWQQRLLESPAGDELWRYWRDRLGGELPTLALPSDRPRPPHQTFRGAAREFFLDPRLSGAVGALAARLRTTLSTALLAVFQVLLARYSGQRDILVAIPALGRNRSAFREVIGYFVNPVVIRADLESRQSLVELLEQVRQRVIEALAHQEYPFALLVERLQPERDPSRSPIFQVMFALQQSSLLSTADLLTFVLGRGGVELDFAGLPAESYPLQQRVARLDLELNAAELGDHLGFSMLYNVDLFDASTVARLLGHFRVLLEGATADPSRALFELPMLSAAERHAVLFGWNDSAAPLAAEELYHRVFEAQTRCTPDATAVLCDGVELTYRQLNQRANRLARALIDAGVEIEQRVAVLSERGPDLVAAILASFKAGSVYLPLDPNHPERRIRQTLEQSASTVLLVSEELEALGEKTVAGLADPPRRLRLETMLADQGRSPDDLARAVAPDNLAYIIHTSGSTGVPKGAMVTHRGMFNHLQAKLLDLSISAADTVAQNSSQCFDISIWQFLSGLLVGGKVCIFRDDVAYDPNRLLTRVDEAGVTIFETVPSMLSALLSAWPAEAAGEKPTLAALRWLVATGEALPGELCRQWYEHYPAIPIVNAYGPTECSDDVTHAVIRAPSKTGQVRAPIGRPVLNTRLYVLDGALQPVAPKLVGELYVGGRGVGRGYLHDPRRTCDVFLPDPFGEDAGARLYRTGDLVRALTDSQLEFLGRVDHQIKVRGFRIELEEIETVLGSHPGVHEVVVIARSDKRDAADLRLTAYVVPDTGYKATQGEDGPVPVEGAAMVDQWRMIFGDAYRGSVFSEQDEAISLRLWIDSYTGEPFPEAEILESVENSVARILALEPRRVLEIGCGTGLLLVRIAPECDLYCGSDFSAEALEQAKRQLAQLEGDVASRVELLAAAAHELEAFDQSSFDTVVLNEIVQYFPNVEYLVRALEGAIDLVEPGGSVFVGGLRSFPLLQAFHLSVQLARAPAELSLGDLRRRVGVQVSQEKELLIDPRFFLALQQRLPRVTEVRFQLKGGHCRNEFTRFRYDVILGIETAVSPAPKQLDGRAEGTLEALRRELAATASTGIAWVDLPNPRLRQEILALDLLAELAADATVAGLRSAIQSAPDSGRGVDPMDLWALGEETGHAVEVAWAASGALDRLDVTFTPVGVRKTASRLADASLRSQEFGPWSRYANRPQAGVAAAELVPELRTHVREFLPEYMIPGAFVLLPAFPLTPNGKVDRAALPEPEARDVEIGDAEAPRNQVEELLVDVWRDVLGLERLGTTQDFFELGGHSLLATQVLSRVREIFAIELPIRSFFENPTVAGLATRLEEAQGTSAPPLAALRPDASAVPVASFAQERMWFLQRLDPHGAAYNVPGAVRFDGVLEVDVLERSLGLVARRHETLRCVFREDDGRPVPVIQDVPTRRLNLIDLRGLGEGAQEEGQRLLREESRRPFDLAVGPLLRTTLLRLGADRHDLLVTLHHIISDGWSQAVLVRELSVLYDALQQGEPSPLPELEVQYRAYGHWQRQWLGGAAYSVQLAYWKQQLAAADPTVDLPADSPRPPRWSYRGRRLDVALPVELSAELSTLSLRHGATLFMTLMAAWVTLLHRLSGQSDLSIGTPIANRNQAATEGLIGLFVNTLVLRARPAPATSFLDLLHGVREGALEAYAHQDLPFERLVDELQPERDRSRNPLFQTMFILQNAPFEALRLPGLEISVRELDNGTAKFDFTLSLEETPRGLDGWLEYSTEIYSRATAERLFGNFHQLLRSITADPESQLASLSILSPQERRQLLTLWHEQPLPEGAEGTIHGLFEAQVRRTPDAVAVVAGGVETTYQELDARADLLAHRLCALGVGAETVVAIQPLRRVEMIVAMLGTLKAGGAYVPIDPSYPHDRRAFMLADSGAQILLTHEDLMQREDAIGRDAGIEILHLDGLEEAVEPHGARGPGRQVAPEAAAYLIYTSGSTGRPKAVSLEHRSVRALLCWAGQCFAPEELACVLATTSICFDVSVFELFAPLAWGGRVQLVESVLDVPRLDPAAEATLLCTVPSAMPELLRRGGLPPSLLAVNLAGEPLRGALAEQIYYQSRVQRVNNVYGPTEDTTYSTLATVVRGAAREPAIGRPIAGGEALVLDARLQPVPVGVLGELLLAGAGLARGYVRRPALTADRFTPHPFSTDPGRRLYRTGDLARFRGDGELEFLGRADRQVKIRGFRIELEEVETILLEHPAVSEGAVVTFEAGPDDLRLVAYVVFAEEPVASAALGRYLRQKLPDHMVPSRFMPLSALPLTPNGKLDRKALPEPDGARPEDIGRYLAPRNALEKELATIWADVLGLRQVGVQDDFFALGGHSLLATRLQSRIGRSFEVEIPLRSLFDSPTVAGQAEFLGSARAGEQPPLAPIPRQTRPSGEAHSRLPLSFAQERLWVIEQLIPGNSAYHVGQALQLSGPLDRGLLRESFTRLLARHEVLRTSFALAADRKPCQVIARRCELDWQEIDLTSVPIEQRDERSRQEADAEARQPFRLDRAPLLRLRLLGFDAEHHSLVLLMHHLICDDWSIGIMIRQIATIYRALARGEQPDLPELPIQYGDYAVWQKEWLSGDVLETKLAFWQQHLSGRLPVLELPTDRPRPPVQGFRGASLGFELPAALTGALRARSRELGCTLFMTLLGGFATLLSRLSGQDDLVIGCPVANRDHPDSEELVGMFVNLMPLRIGFEGVSSYRTLLERVRRIALDGYHHQDVPFERIVEALAPVRDMSRHAINQAGFSFENSSGRVGELTEDVTFTPIQIDTGSSRFDLNLFLWDRGDELGGLCEYSTDLFDAETIGRFVQFYRDLLEDLVADPDQPLLELPAAGEAEWVDVSNLTAAQHVLWNAVQDDPRVPCWEHELFALRLEGAVDPDHFRRAFGKLVELTDALRTVFRVIEGTPRRVVREDLEAAVEQVDLSGEADARASLNAWLAQRSQVPLNLEVQPFDTALVQLSPRRWVWYLNLHPLVADARSLPLVITETARLYEASRQGRLDRAQAAASFELYFDAQRSKRSSRRYREARRYWEAQLAAPYQSDTFYLPASVEPGTATERVSIRVDGDDATKLCELVEREALATPSVVLAAVCLAWMCRLNGRAMQRLGMPFTDAADAFAEIIGQQTNACPLQIEVEAAETFRSLLAKVKKDLDEKRPHAVFPVPSAAIELAYSAYFSYRESGPERFAELPARLESVPCGRSRFLFALQARRLPPAEGFVLDFDFNREAFDAGERQRSVDHYLLLLGTCLDAPDRNLHRVEMLLPGEQQQIAELNSTAVSYPQDLRLEQLFRKQVEQSPDAVAVVDARRQLTYRDLDRQADRLAQSLRSAGVGPDVFVGIAAERCVELVVGLLGILKAGGAYVPLEPTYPKQRLEFMLEDARIQVLVSQERFLQRLPQGVEVLCLEAGVAETTSTRDSDPPVAGPAGSLAYMIYTSGSTGQPKGVMISHDGIVNRLRWGQDAYGLTREDRVLQKTPYSFDVSVWEFFWPLLNGATLVMARPDGHRDPRYLARSIAEQRISTMHFVPSMLQAFLDQANLPADCGSLEKVFCSGEALSDELREKFFDTFGEQAPELHNLYGPTEASVEVTAWRCPRNNPSGVVPIGRPIANVRAYVVGYHGARVPLGIAGELLLGGRNLARGYFRRPALTAERFIPDAFGDQAGDRLYRTGDSARHLRDGTVEFLGRLDHQVKVRGFRIELGEIEAVIERHTGVREVAVNAWQDAAENTHLVAYWVPAGEPFPTHEELRRHAGASLPDYMVPTAWIELDSMPLTASGKLDRKGLPEPDFNLQAAAGEFVAPETPLEILLSSVFEDVLDLDEISVHASFFELGGNSLLATQVVTMLQELLPLELTLRNMFESPTVSAIAAQIEESRHLLSDEDNALMEEVLADFSRLSAGEEAEEEVLIY